MTSKPGTSIRVDRDLHTRIRDIAFLQQESMSEVIEQAIGEYLSIRPDLVARMDLVAQARTSEYGPDTA
jgi:predicted transcriptional regulator